MAYSEKVIDHYENPRNVGSFDNSDDSVGSGMVGAPACGDVMKLQIKVNNEGIIEDARFKTYGCGSAIASSSLVTEWVKGKSLDEAQAIVEEGAELFRSAGIESVAMADLQQARWQKLVWNVPYNGLSVLLNAGTRRLMDSADIRALILELMREVARGAAVCGQTLPDGYPEQLLAATDRMPDYLPSMYHDFRHGRPAELEAIYEAPLAAAAAAGCELPKMRMLLQALRFLEAARG